MSRNASKEATFGDVSYRLEAMIDEDGVTTGSISVSSTGELVGHLTAQLEHLAVLEWALAKSPVRRV
jgi:hypothetical protein